MVTFIVTKRLTKRQKIKSTNNMKTLKTAILALFAITGLAGQAFAQSEESRSVSGYHGLNSGGSFDVHIKIDGTESLRLKGDADDLRRIETTVENGVLRIKPKDENSKYNRFGHIDIYVTAKTLSSLGMGGSGSIEVDGVIKGDKVKLNMGGSGNITTAVEGGDLHASVAGSGNITLKGRAKAADISIAGSGHLRGESLKVDDAEISIAGSGDVHMEIEKSISAHIAGSGNVVYSGNATQSTVSTAGSGRVTKVK
jgi:hypothetical protein